MKINILNVVLLRKRCYNKAIINKRDDTHMEPVRLLEALAVAEKLKDATRHCYTSGGRRESVAEHSWRITLMAYFVSDEFPEADIEKLMKMCLIHDLGEAFTGDIPTFEKTESDEEKEAQRLKEWVRQLPKPFAEEMQALGWEKGEDGIYVRNGERFHFTIQTRDYEEERIDIANLMSAMLKQAGVEMEVVLVAKFDWNAGYDGFLAGFCHAV